MNAWGYVLATRCTGDIDHLGCSPAISVYHRYVFTQLNEAFRYEQHMLDILALEPDSVPRLETHTSVPATHPNQTVNNPVCCSINIV